jgi:hypothetical protein
VLRIFCPKRDEMTGGQRTLHSEELHSLYFSPNIVRMIKSRTMRWAGHVVHIGEMRNAYKILVRKPEEKTPLKRLRCRWEDNIKTNLKKTGWEVLDWNWWWGLTIVIFAVHSLIIFKIIQ